MYFKISLWVLCGEWAVAGGVGTDGMRRTS